MDNSDYLEPWGLAGPPPVGDWTADVLGEGFQCRSFQLPEDEEGEVFTTLIRHLPAEDPVMRSGKTPWLPLITPKLPPFTVLYIHGRNDYFFQTELARQISSAGGHFYAIDLRKYGRSLRPWQTIGYIDDLNLYDQDLKIVIQEIKETHKNLPFFLMGHSTGGLVATLWAWRHAGQCAGLILNSAWLELQALAPLRPALQHVVGKLAKHHPRSTVTHSESDHYWRSLKKGWAGSGFDLPAHLSNFRDDPAVAGWQFFDQWKRPESYPAPAAWLEAVMYGQQQIAEEVHLACPILSLCAKDSSLHGQWNPGVFDTDIVLDVQAIVERAAHLSDHVTIARLAGRHDLALSDPKTRERYYQTISDWIRQVLSGTRD